MKYKLRKMKEEKRKFDGKLFTFKKYIPDWRGKKETDSFVNSLRKQGYFVRKTKWSIKGKGSGYDIWVRRK